MIAKQRKRRKTRSARSGRGSSRDARSRALSEQAREDSPGQPGVIVAHHGVAVDVRLDPGPTSAPEAGPAPETGVAAELGPKTDAETGTDSPSAASRPVSVSVKVRRRSGHVVGDRVEVFGERLRRLERDNELRRRDAFGRVHVVSANLDVLGIVVAPRPASPAGFVDRALISALSSGVRPFLVLNKAELPEAEALATSLRETYVDGPGGIDLTILEVSAKAALGLDALREFFARGERRGAFVGTSGVGKSSLVNALLPEVALGVGEINEHSGLGRHTTTTATLHRLPGGGELIDTPGFRDFGLVDLDVRELARFFPGFFEILSRETCRFSDCRHLVEPDCAIRAAVADGRLATARWQRYRDLVAEISS
ncbi:ribosome small subunit-dependent GTPase A [Pseudenhygromyxa sp. WMMC2535]|uniref:ribosome small subunit-dependent GTPase A n=1 Tax=Pseudenhygromyxa sp. WMMC2535 TaxID=2712867 RepID=UPI0031F92400